MNTTSLSNTHDGSEKKWTRARIAAAVAAGALTTEAAHILYAQLPHTVDPEPNPGPADPDPIPMPGPEPIPASADSDPISVLGVEPIPGSADSDPISVPETEPISGSDDFERWQLDEEDIVEVIVEEMDPLDIDMKDILLVDEIGTVFTVYGEELNVAFIHDSNGYPAMMVDVDHDNVYDVIVSSEGEVIAQVPGDIDVSDVEELYAQQHGDTNYVEQNNFDLAMNENHGDIQQDIFLT